MKPLTPMSSNTTAHNYTTFHTDRTMIVTTASEYTLNIMKQDITTTFNKAFKCLSKNKLFLFLSTAVGKRCGFLQFTKKPRQGYRCIYAVAYVNTARSMQSCGHTSPFTSVVPSFCLYQALLFNTFPTIPSFKAFENFLEQ